MSWHGICKVAVRFQAELYNFSQALRHPDDIRPQYDDYDYDYYDNEQEAYDYERFQNYNREYSESDILEMLSDARRGLRASDGKDVLDSILFKTADSTVIGVCSSLISISGKSSAEIVAKSA